MDVKNIFLHGDKEEVYMQQPPLYVENDAYKWVCKLNKFLYGLKQASSSWFDSFSSQMQLHSLSKSALDYFLFIYTGNGTTTWLLISMILLSQEVILIIFISSSQC